MSRSHDWAVAVSANLLLADRVARETRNRSRKPYPPRCDDCGGEQYDTGYMGWGCRNCEQEMTI